MRETQCHCGDVSFRHTRNKAGQLLTDSSDQLLHCTVGHALQENMRNRWRKSKAIKKRDAEENEEKIQRIEIITLMLNLSLMTLPSTLSATARVSLASTFTMFLVRNFFKSLLILLSTRAVADARASAVFSNLEKLLSDTLK